MENEKIFSTRDIYLASTLITLEFCLEGIDYQIEGERKRPVGYFNFEETVELKKKEKDYWTNKLLIEPKAYMMNLRGLKSQINNIYKSPSSSFNSQ